MNYNIYVYYLFKNTRKRLISLHTHPDTKYNNIQNIILLIIYRP